MKTIAQRLGWVGLLLGLVGFGASSCTTEAYCFVCEDDPFGQAGETSTTRPSSAVSTSGVFIGGMGGTKGDGGQAGADNGGQAGSEGSCEPNPNFQSDPRNCGACGVECRANGAVPLCIDGQCTWEECRPGRWDFNNDPSDGCETQCSPSNDGVEICDGVDNDCNGVVDDDFDLTTVDNCGSCGNECRLAHATPVCEEVNGRYQCQVGECEEDWYDFDGVRDNGCEKQCVESNGGVEVCDGKDNDCDGKIDEETPNAGKDCDEGLCPWDPQGRCLGACAQRGTYVCSGNQLICVPKPGAPSQGIEVCDADGVDEDCDGQANEDFDLMNDPNNCGACGNVCNVPNAFADCVNGQCVVGACKNGFNDLDPNTPGCEYACPESVNQEKCDGIDNDCDGEIDEAGDLAPPTQACLQTGPCSGSTWVCGTIPNKSETGWYCNYQSIDSRIEVDPETVWPGPELACDTFDNNCDGYIDEGMGRYQFCRNANDCIGGCNRGRCGCSTDNDCDFGYGCTGGRCVAQCFDGIGVCQDVELVQCAADGDGIVCPAAAVTSNAKDEVCDGLDNNCDGQIDEANPAPGNAFSGVQEDVVFIENGSTDFYIYRYEASRPDAVSDDGGVSDARACSKAGVIPWSSVNQAEAAAACSAAGMRLCSQSEWMRACRIGSNSNAVWSYASSPATYSAGKCNDVEHPGAFGTAWPTGSAASCAANGQVFDMSGNVSEWTSTQASSAGNNYFRIRGGNYTSYGPATKCDFSFVLGVPTFANADLGFRCCSTTDPNN